MRLSLPLKLFIFNFNKSPHMHTCFSLYNDILWWTLLQCTDGMNHSYFLKGYRAVCEDLFTWLQALQSTWWNEPYRADWNSVDWPADIWEAWLPCNDDDAVWVKVALNFLLAQRNFRIQQEWCQGTKLRFLCAVENPTCCSHTCNWPTVYINQPQH